MKLSIRGRVLTLVLTSVFAALLLVESVAFYTVRSSHMIIARQAAVLEESVDEDELGRMEDFLQMSNEVIADSQKKAVLLLLPLLMCIIYACNYMAGRVTRPIRELKDGVREIATGNLAKKVELHTGDEIEDLAECFNNMTEELQTHVEKLTAATAEKERFLTELAVARNIQLGALPKDFLSDRHSFELYANMMPALDVGGDFYDFYMRDEGHLVVTIADVCGKGIPAALFMMRAKTTLKNLVMLAQASDDIAAVMALANQELCRDNQRRMFVTVLIAQLDLETGELIYVNCGHNPPLVRQNGTVQYLHQKTYQLALGLAENVNYETRKLSFSPGDVLFLYTDGVTEAMNHDKEQYSNQRLKVCFDLMCEKASMQEMLAAVKNDISVHVKGAEQSDDITMLGLKFCGAGRYLGLSC